MSSVLSSPVDNLSEGLYNDKCTDCKSCLDHMTTKDEQLIFRCFKCKKNYECLSYEYMDIWETSLPDKEASYGSLNMEDIIDVDHRHAKRVFKSLNNKNLGDYHDLYVQSDTLLLGDIFENFRNMCIEVYELDPALFFISTRIIMASMFKEIRCEIRTAN